MRSDHIATVLMSGGIDSAACTHLLCTKHIRTRALFIDYGQKAAIQEARAAERIADHFAVELKNIKVSCFEGLGIGEILGRNMLLISIALMNVETSSGSIVIGVHDGSGYSDCTASFINQMDRTVRDQTDGRYGVMAPFINWQKKDVFDYFYGEGLPLHLTYSCEAGDESPCGNCASCRDRKAL